MFRRKSRRPSGPLAGIPVASESERRHLALRALRDRPRWTMPQTVGATIVTVADVGLSQEHAQRPYLEFDVRVAGDRHLIATGERIDHVHLAHIGVGRPVMVSIDPANPACIAIDWSSTFEDANGAAG